MQGSRLNAKAIKSNNKTRIWILYSNIVTTKNESRIQNLGKFFRCWKIHPMVNENPNKGLANKAAGRGGLAREVCRGFH